MLADSFSVYLAAAGDFLSAVWGVLVPVAGAIWGGFQAVLGPFLAAAFAAWLGFRYWRRQRWIERRSEFAEQTLRDFYEARTAIILARDPIAAGSEGSSRPWKNPSETEEQKPYLDAFYAPVERLERHGDLFGRIQASRFKAMALFGPEADEPFTKLASVYNTIIHSSRSLIGHADEEWHGKERLADKWQHNIGWVLEGKDELAGKVEKAVMEIEEICRPFVELNRP